MLQNGSWIATFRCSARSLGKDRISLVVMTASLSVALALSSATFRWVTEALLRPLRGVAEPDQLVLLSVQQFDGRREYAFSYPDYAAFRDGQSALSGAIAWGTVQCALEGRAGPRRAIAAMVSSNYFADLGVRTALGRIPSAEFDGAVLSAETWRNDYRADPGIIGRTVTLNGRPFSVLAVTAPGFRGTSGILTPAVWVHLGAAPVLVPDVKGLLTSADASWLSIMGRLRPQTGRQQAQAALSVVQARLDDEIAQHRRGKLLLEPGRSGDGLRRRPGVALLALLMAASFIVVILAFTNSAGIMLARNLSRRMEFATRLALGASRTAIVGMVLCDALIVAAMAAAAGFVGGTGLAQVLGKVIGPAFGGHAEAQVTFDGTVFVFTAVLAVAVCVLFGLGPALRASCLQPWPVLTGHGLGIGPGRRGLWGRGALVVAQVAIGTALLITADLIGTSVENMQSVSPGFVTGNLLFVTVASSATKAPELSDREYRETVRRLQQTPLVQCATFAHRLPLTGGGTATSLWNDSRQASEMVDSNTVGPHYAGCMGLRILAGRDFDESDTNNSLRVALVSESLARRLGGGAAVVGRTIRTHAADPVGIVIAGVVSDAKYYGLELEARSCLYRPASQIPASGMSMLVRTRTGANDLSRVQREIVKSGRLIVVDQGAVAERMQESLLPLRLVSWMLVCSSGLAILLAVGGLYGITSHFTAQRRHEFAIRTAVGATQSDIMLLVLTWSGRMAAAGVLAGVLLASAVAGGLSRILYRVSPRDPAMLVPSVMLMTAVVLAACVVPATRAARDEPSRTLRS